jgi:hypothetical protein
MVVGQAQWCAVVHILGRRLGLVLDDLLWHGAEHRGRFTGLQSLSSDADLKAQMTHIFGKNVKLEKLGLVITEKLGGRYTAP